ncbi:MAG TPA: AI-2E family transporter [Chloroflexi bacterium]|nr:AI-2E family transporter [Chloroflexota bacterium]
MNEPGLDRTPRFSNSPRWSSTTKMVVAITLVAITGGLLLRFRQIIGPILASFVLAYLMYPLASLIVRRVRISWRFAVTLLYLLLLMIIIGSLTASGLALVEQVQSLITFLQRQVREFPEFIDQLSQTRIDLFGMFVLDFNQLNLDDITNSILGVVQPMLSELGSLVGAIASGAVSIVGWILFSLLISYFLLADSGGMREKLIQVRIPGYQEDINRMGEELGRIWNAFLRGQLTLFLITVGIYVLLLGVLGVRFYYGLALLAGLARFVPYIGPGVTWVTYGLVSFLQGTTLFGLQPLAYSLVVVGIALLVDIFMDNYVTPRMMGSALKVHPAAVMVAAIVSANLFGIIGMVFASPVLATLKLVITYIGKKMFDLDPWEDFQRGEAPPLPPIQDQIKAQWQQRITALQQARQAVARRVKRTRKPSI